MQHKVGMKSEWDERYQRNFILKCNHNIFNNHANTRTFSPPRYDSWLTHTLKLICVFYMHTNYTCMFISRVKYSEVEFATGDLHTLVLYKGAPTCQWKNICEHVKRRPAKEQLTTIWFNRPIFGLGLSQQMIMNLHDSNISRHPRTMAKSSYIMRKPALCHMQTTKTQISLCIHAAWSAPLLFTDWIVYNLHLLNLKFQD